MAADEEAELAGVMAHETATLRPPRRAGQTKVNFAQMPPFRS